MRSNVVGIAGELICRQRRIDSAVFPGQANFPEAYKVVV